MATSAIHKTTNGLAAPLKAQLDRLAAFEPDGSPVISLYLDMRPNEIGRDNYEIFMRKTVPDHVRTFYGAARSQVEADFERIQRYLAAEVRTSANGLAVFASGDRLFEALQLDAPIEQHWLSIGETPHLYPLARVIDQYPRYAAVLVNTNSARIFVFSLGAIEARREVTNEKTRRTTMGGWAQARYQRHNENVHLHHIKEVADTLTRLVTEEAIDKIVLSCEEVARPLLMEQLPKHVAERVVDMVNLPAAAPEHEVLHETLLAMREHDADTDTAVVEQLIGAWRSGGLAVVGAQRTKRALDMGQVDTLVIAADPQKAGGPDTANELVTKAQQTNASIRFIEDAALLEDVGGVGALLRFRI